MFGARHGMGGDQVDARGQVRPDVADHGLLDRADVADDGAWLERWADGGGDPGVGAKRRAQHDKVGVGDGLAGIQGDAVGETQVHGRVQGLSGARGDGDVLGQAVAPDDVGEG